MEFDVRVGLSWAKVRGRHNAADRGQRQKEFILYGRLCNSNNDDLAAIVIDFFQASSDANVTKSQ